ncbi:MAG TPA: TraR/DksA C4-type zinc finger protein [Ktedonobacterales bacterium]
MTSVRSLSVGQQRLVNRGHKSSSKPLQRPTDTAVGPARMAPVRGEERTIQAAPAAVKEDRAVLIPPGLVDQLRERQAELLAKLERLEGEGRDEDEDSRPRYSNHPADEAVALLDRAGRDAIARVLREDMVQVDRALDRVAEGRYGLCEDCHQPIPPKRLEVRPTATLCVSCQAQREARVARNARPIAH